VALRLVIAHTPAERDAAQAVEARVFLQAFGNTPDVMEHEYGPYRDRSRFVTVIDDSDGSALGAARLVLPGDTGTVKTLVDVAGDPWYLSASDVLQSAGLAGQPVYDVASLAVDRRYRSGANGAEVTVALCHGLLRFSQNCGARGLVTVLDDRVLRLLRAMGVPWAPMAGATSRSYLGSPASTPCIATVSSIAENIRAVRPDLAPAVVDGVFRSIVAEPADLHPTRGSDLQEGPAPSRPVAPRRDTSAWKPPGRRRAEGRIDASLL
jgi:hypothetical protein